MDTRRGNVRPTATVITVSEKVLFGAFLGVLVVLLFVTGIVLVVT